MKTEKNKNIEKMAYEKYVDYMVGQLLSDPGSRRLLEKKLQEAGMIRSRGDFIEVEFMDPAFMEEILPASGFNQYAVQMHREYCFDDIIIGCQGYVSDPYCPDLVTEMVDLNEKIYLFIHDRCSYREAMEGLRAAEEERAENERL